MASINLSLQQYLLWNQNKLINPKTNREIKEDGPTYQKIKEGWEKLQRDNDFTENECLEWIKNKTLNPKTKRTIKKGQLKYETIRNKCEIYDDEIEGKEFLLNIVNDKKDCGNKKSPQCNSISKNPLSLICHGETCMMKGCPWDGKYGINFSLFPKVFIIGIKLFFPYLNTERCCCFCFGHLVVFMSFVGHKTATSCLPKSVKDIMKTQTTIDRLQAIESDVDKFVNKVFINEANVQLTKYTVSTFKDGLPVLNDLLYEIKENTSTVFSSIISGLSDAIETFTCS